MALANIQQLKHALKEWAIAVDALTAGKTVILLRKGGIREKGFQVKHRLVWLYPTFEHQKPHLLKPEYASEVVSVKSGWHPEAIAEPGRSPIAIKSCAEVTDVLAVDNRNHIEALQPYHIWNSEMIDERLQWKPDQPLMVLLLKVYRLTQPQVIPYHKQYRGCKSWIDLVKPIATEQLIPVMEDRKYNQISQEIKMLLI